MNHTDGDTEGSVHSRHAQIPCELDHNFSSIRLARGLPVLEPKSSLFRSFSAVLGAILKLSLPPDLLLGAGNIIRSPATLHV